MKTVRIVMKQIFLKLHVTENREDNQIFLMTVYSHRCGQYSQREK